jgi:hypothetical protein
LMTDETFDEAAGGSARSTITARGHSVRKMTKSYLLI